MAFITSPSPLPDLKLTSTCHTPQSLINFANKKSISTNPLDIATLIESLGIDVRYEPLENNISGILKKNPETNKWIIYVNSLHHPHRQRFTLAHELAHYCRHTPIDDEFVDKIFFRGSKFSSMESEANRFAAELLMPEDKFREQVSLSPKVEDIAKHFQVSSAAVLYRAQELGFKGKSE
jgi:ribosomal protein L22